MGLIEVIIDGDSFNDFEGFYHEIEIKLTKGLGWHIGRNLNALNDILIGGFGIGEYEEPYKLIWLNISKSQVDLKNDLFDAIMDIIKRNEHVELIQK